MSWFARKPAVKVNWLGGRALPRLFGFGSLRAITLSPMKSRLLASLALVSALVSQVLAADKPAAPGAVTTTKKTNLVLSGGNIALAKGTKLEVVSQEGDSLLVKFRAAQGKVLAADTDFVPTGAPSAPAEPSPAVSTPVAAPAKAATPPALSTNPAARQPKTTYGKAIQKAKQATEAHQGTHVDPTKGIMDDDAPKK